MSAQASLPSQPSEPPEREQLEPPGPDAVPVSGGEPTDHADTPPGRIAGPMRTMVQSGWFAVIGYVVSRAAMMHDWAAHYTYIVGDPRYYFWSLTSTPSMATRLREYPAPAVFLLHLFQWPSANQDSYYVTAFAVGMALLDALFAVLLWRSGGRIATWYWLAFGFLMGPLMWFRFDMIPAVIVGLALLWAARRPGVAGALVGLGASVKLWPALLLLPMLHRDDAGRRRVIGFAGAGFLLALVSWAWVGWTRLVSPLSWQSERGLQIESLAATPLMAAHQFSAADRWQVIYSKFNAYELTGPGVGLALKVSSGLMVLMVAVSVLLALLVWSRSRVDADTLTLASITVVCMVIAANKTLSPQYMFWLGAPLAVLLKHARPLAATVPPGDTDAATDAQAAHDRTRVGFAQAAALGVLGLAIARLTQYVYPNHYGALIYDSDSDGRVTMALVARNVLVVVIAITSVVWTVLHLLRTPRTPLRTGSRPERSAR